MFAAISSGLHKDEDGTLHVVQMSEEEKRLNRVLEFIWSKIDERFSKLQEAFRFFDKNNNSKVTFPEF